MTAIIPITYLLLISYFIKIYSFRIAFINAFLVLSIQILFITEFLSLFNYLNTTSVFILHSLFAFVYLLFSKRINIPKVDLKFMGLTDKIMLSVIFFISFITFFIAIYSPPNNWDSMTYHMARIPHWIQNSGVDFFITNNYRQNLYSPFSEFMILNLQVLSQSDQFANLVQWFSLMISMLVISVICNEFGLNKKMQLLSAFFIITLPTSILEASTTQNDIVLSAFILIFYFYQLRIIDSPSKSNLIFSGFSLGLGILTKGSSYIFFFPVGFTCFIYMMLKSETKTKLIIFGRSLMIVSIGFLLNIPHYVRSYTRYNDFLGMDLNHGVVNEVFSFFTIYSNFFRHIAYQLGSNFQIINWYIYRFVQILLGDSLNDPKTSFLGLDFRPPFFSITEDHAGNVIHTFLIIILCVISIMLFKKMSKKQLISMWIPFLAIVLYCLLLKWQPYTNKMLPLFIIISPFIIIIINNIIKFERLKTIIYIVFCFMFLLSVPYLFYSKARPILPLDSESILNKNRFEIYFSKRPELFNQYNDIVKKIYSISKEDLFFDSIAIHIGGDSWEYPFWVMLNEKFRDRLPYIYHFKKEHVDSKLYNYEKPNYIIFENIYLEDFAEVKNSYEKVLITEDFSLLKK